MSRRAPAAIVAALLLVAALAPAGCGGRGAALPEPTAERLDALLDLVARGKHYDAIQGLTEFLREHPGTSRIDEAVYGLGRAYLGSRQWQLAEDQFARLIRDFPYSAKVPDATFDLSFAIYRQSRPAQLDPTLTVRGRDQFRVFLKAYPDHPRAEEARTCERELDERLAEKKYMAGETYRKTRRFEAARLSYARVTEEHPESAWARRAALRIGEVLLAEEKKAEALAQFEKVVTQWPGSPEAKQAEARLPDRTP
jgi:outer membrane protein assembly factor BamD